MSETWMEFAYCKDADPNEFFLFEYNKTNVRKVAAKWCDHCPVVEACGEYGKRTGIGGITGGTSPAAKGVRKWGYANTGWTITPADLSGFDEDAYRKSKFTADYSENVSEIDAAIRRRRELRIKHGVSNG